MESVEDAVIFFEEEIYQIGIAEDGILTESYRDYLSSKKSYYQLAVDSIKSHYPKNNTITERINIIQNGAGFGERDIYSPDCYYPYRLVGVLCPLSGEIVVKDLSAKPLRTFVTNIMFVYIEGID